MTTLTVPVPRRIRSKRGKGLLRVAQILRSPVLGRPPDGAAITVDMLLRLRSGLPDYTGPLMGNPPTDLSALERYWSPEQLVAAALAL